MKFQKIINSITHASDMMGADAMEITITIRKSNRMRTIMAQVLDITSLQAGPA
jgi:hypothetical protein